MTKYQEIIRYIRENGGISYSSYQYDVKYSNYKKSFETWKIGWVQNYFGVSYSVAKNVIEKY
jgi:predicted 3-demethylubiquinone-9 3-methyltransferase (glyoxalase superfamily)